VECLSGKEDAHRILVGKPEGTRVLGDMVGIDQWFLTVGYEQWGLVGWVCVCRF
jgi:hypothetical protein